MFDQPPPDTLSLPVLAHREAYQFGLSGAFPIEKLQVADNGHSVASNEDAPEVSIALNCRRGVVGQREKVGQHVA